MPNIKPKKPFDITHYVKGPPLRKYTHAGDRAKFYVNAITDDYNHEAIYITKLLLLPKPDSATGNYMKLVKVFKGACLYKSVTIYKPDTLVELLNMSRRALDQLRHFKEIHKDHEN